MKNLIHQYFDAYKGLSKEIWYLAFITLINRAGTMVIPFLSLYLTEDLEFGLTEVGWIMSAFGIGSTAGGWIGGKLTDQIGAYKVMFSSLFLSGLCFIGIQFVQEFWMLCIAIFLLMTIADSFRPAIFVALSSYSKPENRTRSLTLIRLAINLGFSFGPAIGGLIIIQMGYSGLFYIDGFTCIGASIIFLALLHPKKAKVLHKEKIPDQPLKAHKDRPYVLFVLTMVFMAVAFVQYFSTIPIYYRDIHHLSEFQIGLLMFMNGAIIALFEMPLVKYFESKSWSNLDNYFIGLLLIAASFLILISSTWVGVLIIGMFLMTIGEMIAFPFSNAYAMERSKLGKKGQYMGLYSMSFSISHIFGHNGSLNFIEKYGFDLTWIVMTAILVLASIIVMRLQHKRFQLYSISVLTFKHKLRKK
ncbi:MAG: MFS transporter [Flavobacteriaceae bacterium]|nr:MFS transporter [Flavobacteriaceae bacterium]